MGAIELGFAVPASPCESARQLLQHLKEEAPPEVHIERVRDDPRFDAGNVCYQFGGRVIGRPLRRAC
jgi:hypothetical protein